MSTSEEKDGEGLKPSKYTKRRDRTFINSVDGHETKVVHLFEFVSLLSHGIQTFLRQYKVRDIMKRAWILDSTPTLEQSS